MEVKKLPFLSPEHVRYISSTPTALNETQLAKVKSVCLQFRLNCQFEGLQSKRTKHFQFERAVRFIFMAITIAAISSSGSNQERINSRTLQGRMQPAALRSGKP
jgi:hypothetical protein